MSKEIKKMLRTAKPIIKAFGNGNKQKEKSTHDTFEASINFAMSFYELGKLHKAENRVMQNFEQFMYFNKFHDLDFAKENVSPQRRKQMTADFIKMVVYPAYTGGFNGQSLF